jgi:hypothetical protein
MLKHRISELFEDEDPAVQRVLSKVLVVEQQYITEPLRTNSIVLKEVRKQIDNIIEEVCRDETLSAEC